MNTHILYTAALLPLTGLHACSQAQKPQKPNVLFVIADDQSYPYAGAYGCRSVSTPGFDFVARNGVLFTNAYCTSPGSSPSRASILTGLYPWQIEEAGTHASSFPSRYTTYPDMLKEAGYLTGYTGKGWGPGDWQVSGRPYNPAGPEYNDIKLDPPYSGISKIDYTSNFKQFLSERKKGQPFCFWMGTHEPHRPYENASWVKEGYALDKAEVPGFLPASDTVRGDILDYAVEIEWFDKQLSVCLDELKRIGELDNTIVIVTADNGMSFPHAKANCYDAGVHVPLAICWGDKIKPAQVVESLVSLVDIAPTLLDAAGVEYKGVYPLSGISMMSLMTGRKEQYDADAVYSGRERHSFARWNNWGYPMRSVRWGNYLLVRNFHSERWPAGDPQAYDKKGEKLQPMHYAYYDIDDAPSKTYLIDQRDNPAVKPFFEAAVAKRPEYELFDLKNDVDCLHNLAADSRYADVLQKMQVMLGEKLTKTGDTRVTGSDPEIWESYPRLEGKSRSYPEPK